MFSVRELGFAEWSERARAMRPTANGGTLRAVAQGLDDRDEGRRRLAAARIIQVIAAPEGRPLFEHAPQPSL